MTATQRRSFSCTISSAWLLMAMLQACAAPEPQIDATQPTAALHTAGRQQGGETQLRDKEQLSALRSFLDPDSRLWNPAEAAQAANVLISVGEQRAGELLLETNTKPTPHAKKSSKRARRPSWITSYHRMYLITLVYRSGLENPVRSAHIGAPMCPYESMPLSLWPMFPLCLSHGVPLLLAQGWSGTGIPESAQKYLAHCKKHGIFRTHLYRIPTRKHCLAAIQSLQSSARWEKIRWKDKGQGWSYSFSPKSMTHFLQQQAESIED